MDFFPTFPYKYQPRQNSQRQSIYCNIYWPKNQDLAYRLSVTQVCFNVADIAGFIADGDVVRLKGRLGRGYVPLRFYYRYFNRLGFNCLVLSVLGIKIVVTYRRNDHITGTSGDKDFFINFCSSQLVVYPGSVFAGGSSVNSKIRQVWNSRFRN